MSFESRYNSIRIANIILADKVINRSSERIVGKSARLHALVYSISSLELIVIFAKKDVIIQCLGSNSVYLQGKFIIKIEILLRLRNAIAKGNRYSTVI